MSDDINKWIAGRACEALAELSSLYDPEGKEAEALMCDWSGTLDGAGEQTALRVVTRLTELVKLVWARPATGGLAAVPRDGNHESKTLRAAHAAGDARPWREEATSVDDGLGLELMEHNGGAHVQLRQDGKVFAEWWPSSGRTQMDGKRGPICRTGEDLITWLKNA